MRNAHIIEIMYFASVSHVVLGAFVLAKIAFTQRKRKKKRKQTAAKTNNNSIVEKRENEKGKSKRESESVAKNERTNENCNESSGWMERNKQKLLCRFKSVQLKRRDENKSQNAFSAKQS